MKTTVFIFLFLIAAKGGTQPTTAYLDSVFNQSSEYTCDEIRYDFDKSTIRPESLPYLDSIAAFLMKNDSMVLEVQNHRDTRGSDMYGSSLTQRRAQSVVNYLISKGVDVSRLIAKGYGETKPLHTDAEIYSKKSKEEQELLHQKNRRTVFVVIRK